MFESILETLRCPVTRQPLRLTVISEQRKQFLDGEKKIVLEGILSGGSACFYPVINGVPRLIAEAAWDYEDFLKIHLADFENRKKALAAEHGALIAAIRKKNARTKASFTTEWEFFNYEKDRTWDAYASETLTRYLSEMGETPGSLKGKRVLDAGCGNGLGSIMMAKAGAQCIAMDISRSIERAFVYNTHPGVTFIQGDIEYPPVPYSSFDLVYCAGVLVAVPDPVVAFSRIEKCVAPTGKVIIWMYHPRKNFIHNVFNSTRRFTSRLPVKVQYWLYLFTIFPLSFILKITKGKHQNFREMMIDIFDWFSPEFRWETTPAETEQWYRKEGYEEIQVTSSTLFGYSMTGIKNQY